MARLGTSLTRITLCVIVRVLPIHTYLTLRPGGRVGDLFGPSIPRLGIRRVDGLRRVRQPVVSAMTVARVRMTVQ